MKLQMSPENKTCSRWHRHTAHYVSGVSNGGCKSFSHHLYLSLRFCFRFCFSQVPTLLSHINSTQGCSSVPSHFYWSLNLSMPKQSHWLCCHCHLNLTLVHLFFLYNSYLSKWPFYWKLILTDFTPCLCSFLAGLEHKKSEQDTFFFIYTKTAS